MKTKTFIPFLFSILFLVSLNSCKTDSDKIKNVPVEEADTFEIAKGVNISHWLSQSNRRGEDRLAFFTEADVKFIDSVGYDHIRLPIDEEQLWDEEGNKTPEAFDLMHQALAWAGEYNLKSIVDLHIIRSHHFNHDDRPLWTDVAEQEKFVELWRQLSEELKEYPNNMVAYELMNEAVADNPDDWNNLFAKALAVVREEEPDRKVLIGSNRWQSVETFDVLKVPENDPNIILSFHFYIPFALTHHEASWTGIKDYSGPVHYPGKVILEEDLANFPEDVQEDMKYHVNKVFTKDTLLSKMQEPILKAKELGLQLYCGEFGCLPTVPREDRMQWYKDMREVMEANNIAWTHWDYKGGFGIRKGDGSNIDWEFIEVLLK